MIKRIYLAIAVLTFVYLTFLIDFTYSHGNWITAIPANIAASLLWPVYWGYLHWM